MSFLFSFPSPDTSIVNVVCSEVSPVSEFTNGNVANAYNPTQHNNVLSGSMKNKVARSDDSNARGKYNSIDLDEWEEIECHVMDDNRIGVGRDHKYKDATVFIQIKEEGRFDVCKNYLMFHKKDWFEYRKERGDNKYQEPMISSNGVIWVGNTTYVYNFRVFIPVVKAE